MPSPDFPTNHTPNDNPNDTTNELAFSTPSPAELAEPVGGGFSELDNALPEAFAAEVYGIEEEDTTPGDNDKGPTNTPTQASDQLPEIPAPKTPDTAGDGAGGGDEPPKGSSGETGDEENEGRKELEKCFKDIQTVRERMALKDEIPSYSEVREMNNAYLRAADAAGNIDAAKFFLAQMGATTPEEDVKKHIVLDTSGDREAWNELRDRLHQESSDSVTSPYSDGGRPLLDATLKVYREQGIPPDEHIETAVQATSHIKSPEIERQRLLLPHASQIVSEGREYPESTKEQINEIAANLSEDRLMKEGPYAMLATTDPAVGERVLNDYLATFLSSASRRLSDGDLEVVKPLFEVAANLPKSAGFNSTASPTVEALMSMGLALIKEDKNIGQPHDPMEGTTTKNDLLRLYAEAKVIFNLHADTPANATVVCERTARETGTPLQPQGTVYPEELERICAEEYMRMNDAEGAGRLLEDMLDRAYASGLFESETTYRMHAHIDTLHACWRAATTTEQMDTLKPSPRLREAYRAANTEFQLMRARVSDDPDIIAPLARELAHHQDLQASKLATPAHAAGQLTERLAELDPVAGQQLAREILQTFLPRNIDIRSLGSLYNVLRQSPDPADSAFMRISIRLAEGSDASTLNELAKLASAQAARNKKGSS